MRDMERLRFGIIGCGNIAFLKHLPALSAQRGAEIAAFQDSSIDRAREAHDRFGNGRGRVYADYRELLDDPAVDVVHVLTTNKSHSAISVDALEAGKHVMCEKPMAINSKEARRMYETSVRTGKKLTVSYQNRYKPESMALKKMIQTGELGDIYVSKAMSVRRRGIPTWGRFLDREEQGGGALIDVGTHALDLALWLMDNYEPRHLTGNTYDRIGVQEGKTNAWGEWSPGDFTVEDSAFAFITMKNGATIQLDASWALNTTCESEIRVVLCGDKAGADMADRLVINGDEHGNLYNKELLLSKGDFTFYKGNKETVYETEVRMWIDALLNDSDPVVAPEQALVVSEILDAIYQSAQTGKPVFF
jgi:predicted dehydrogenase